MDKTTAVKPDFYNQFTSLRDREIAKKAGVTQEELDYFHLSKTQGWQHFEKLNERLLEELDGLNDKAIEKGVSFEDIGRNTIVVNLTKGILKRLFNKVKDAKEACEKTK